jgi:hypothetical protein
MDMPASHPGGFTADVRRSGTLWLEGWMGPSVWERGNSGFKALSYRLFVLLSDRPANISKAWWSVQTDIQRKVLDCEREIQLSLQILAELTCIQNNSPEELPPEAVRQKYDVTEFERSINFAENVVQIGWEMETQSSKPSVIRVKWGGLRIKQ